MEIQMHGDLVKEKDDLNYTNNQSNGNSFRIYRYSYLFLALVN